VDGKDVTIAWAAPEPGSYKDLTEYRIECRSFGNNREERNGGMEKWRMLGTIVASSNQHSWERKMKVYDFKHYDFNQVRVIAVNEDGESEPGEPNEEPIC